jgi:hypothetical protein
MGDVISIDRQHLLSTLADLVGYPNPDDPGDPDNPFGPYGPWGPVIRSDWLQVAGPVPDPWLVFGPQPDPWRLMGPGPQPWRVGVAYSSRIAALTAAAAVQGVSVARSATGDDGRAHEAARASLAKLVDDYCGTPPRHPPIPGVRFPPPKSEPTPADLTAAALTLHQAGHMVADEALAGMFRDASAQLADRALAAG